MRDKEEIVIKVKKGKLYIALLLLAVLISSIIIRSTQLVQIYIINFITKAILNNVFNILALSTVLVILFIIEKKKFYLKIEK